MRGLYLIFSAVFIFTLNHNVLSQNDKNIFFDASEPKTIETPLEFTMVEMTESNASVTVEIDYSDTIAKVSQFIYGTNANQYASMASNQTNLNAYMRLLSPSIIRYPGGLHRPCHQPVDRLRSRRH